MMRQPVMIEAMACVRRIGAYGCCRSAGLSKVLGVGLGMMVQQRSGIAWMRWRACSMA